jgi:DNA polymerase III subunit epsilon
MKHAGKGSETFVALDFETADYGSDSACAVAIVTVEGGMIIDRFCQLIKPPRRSFAFTYLHGIGWKDVEDKPTFADAWPAIRRRLKRGGFVAAHNARFDKGVLHACCASAGIRPPPTPFLCTVQLARSVWRIRPTRLPNVCEHLSIPLEHHRAESDAEACAHIVMRAMAQGVDVTAFH